MGIFDTLKDLLGSTGVSELVESAGLSEHLEGLTGAAEAPLEGLGAITEDLGTSVEDVTSAVDPRTGLG